MKESSLTALVPFAASDNPAVGVKLVEGYIKVLEDRREQNRDRAAALDDGSAYIGVAIACVTIELILAFIAVAVG